MSAERQREDIALLEQHGIEIETDAIPVDAGGTDTDLLQKFISGTITPVGISADHKFVLKNIAVTNIGAAVSFVTLYDDASVTGQIKYPAIAVQPNDHVRIENIMGCKFSTSVIATASLCVVAGDVTVKVEGYEV